MVEDRHRLLDGCSPDRWLCLRTVRECRGRDISVLYMQDGLDIQDLIHIQAWVVL